MVKFTVEWHDKLYTYEVVQWGPPSPTGVRIGSAVYRDTNQANCVAMAEEYQYNAECEEWALYNSQESEFDYV